jgi:guanylate kinase
MSEPAQINKLQHKLGAYQPSPETIELIRKTLIVLLVGVSGAGKDSIKQKLLATGEYHHIVSHTTRAPRENKGVMEQDGREYHFISLAEAEKMLDDRTFVEAKMYSGNIYGTSVAEIQKAHDDGKIALTDIEVQGVTEYKSIAPNVQAIFVLPPSYEVWQQRLKSRYKESDISPTDIMRRMQTADAELREALQKDYFRFVVNDDLDTAVTAVDAIAHGAPAGKESETAQALAKELLVQVG